MTQRHNFSNKNTNLKNTTVVNESTSSRKYRLLRKYFYKWKDNIHTNLVMNMGQMQKTKINEFITSLKNHQNVLLSNRELKYCKSSVILKPIDKFKSRYRVQNNIIDLQKEKIKEQSKIINELKLGIIREDILKSIENNKNVIREVFGNCSERILCKAPLIQAVGDREKIMISAQKAPKLVQKMQQKAIEREKYRNEILKRKRIKDEEQQELLKEIIKKKTALEEEERKRNLEIINEQRKQELKLQIIRQQKKQQLEQKISLAVNFYNKLLIKQCFKKLLNFYNKSRENASLAAIVFVLKKKLKIFKAWLGYVEAKYTIKYNIADAHFSYKILKHSTTKWMKFKLECVRSLQAAEDLYDLRLTSNIFIHWHRYVCKEVMIEYNKSLIATKHNNRRLLFQYFYQWRYLPAVIQLEKCKEETKRKWREKVLKILPDYRPPETL